MRWFNLVNLLDKEKDDMLHMPIVPEGIFRSAFASMQQRCEAKKKEDEALQLCLPRKASGPPSNVAAQGVHNRTPGSAAESAEAHQACTHPTCLLGASQLG